MATASHNLSYYSMSSADDGEIRYSTLKGHRDFINQTAVNGLAPSQVASVSDDHTCRLWDLNSGACAAVFRLKAPGTALAWNPASPNELLVAERTGLHSPLMSIFMTCQSVRLLFVKQLTTCKSQ